MDLTRTEVQIVEPAVRWASVHIFDRTTGALIEEARMTAAEEQALREKGQVPQRLQAAWESHRVIVSGRLLRPGMALEQGKTLILNYGEEDAASRVSVSIAQLYEGEWDKDIDGVVRVRSDKADELTRKWRTRPLGGGSGRRV